MPVLHFDLSTIPNHLTAQLALKLQAAEGVIAYTKTVVPLGAGNIPEKILSSNYRSYFLAWAGYNWDPYAGWRTNKFWSARTANITTYFGAGNCDLQATVTYSLLRCLPGQAGFNGLYGQAVSICSSDHNLGGVGHTFAVIGSGAAPYNDPQDECVVVDPWPTAPQPVLLSHHFCGGVAGAPMLVWQITKQATKMVGYGTRVTKHWNTLWNYGAGWKKWERLNMAADINNQNWLLGQMQDPTNPQHLFGNRITVNDALLGADKVIYTTRKPWVSDAARTHCKNCNTSFGIITRKHHCRRCGEIFCNKCSSHQNQVGLPATRPGEQPVAKTNGPERVCAACNNIINTMELDNSPYQGGYVGR
jgi:hypothetical protein